MNPIVPNIWQVGGERLTAPGDAAVYLIRFGQEAALIDAGTGSGHGQLVHNITACIPPDVPITRLFLTHCHYDHTGGAGAVRDRYHCKIVVHENEAEFLETGDSAVTAATWYGAEMAPLSIDVRIRKDRQRFSVGTGEITAIFCPGHSPGSVVYLTQMDHQRILFGQDVHGPLHPSLLSDRNAYLHSLRHLIRLQADILCEGHFGIYRGKNTVRRFIGSYLEI